MEIFKNMLTKVCELLKSFYELEQASSKWYEKLSTMLVIQANSNIIASLRDQH